MERALFGRETITSLEVAKDSILFPIKEQDYLIAKPTVSVIIPTLNEAKNLPLVLPFLPMDWVDEVILVDGRSIDGTVDIAQQILPSIKVVLEKKKGKGAAMFAGYQAASGDILVVMDADGSNDPREIPRYIKPLLEGADFVKGSRFAPGGGTTDMPRIRKWGNGTFILLSNLLFDTSFSDLCYGFHAFWRHCLDTFQLNNINGFEIDTVLYLQALRKKMRIVEVPSFEGYRFYGEGKLQTFPDGVRVLKTIFKEWVAAMKQKQTDLYPGFRGQRPMGSSKSSGMNLVTPMFLNMIQIMLAAGEHQRWVVPYFLQTVSMMLQAASGSAVVIDENGDVVDGFLFVDGTLQQACVEVMKDMIQNGLIGWTVRSRQSILVHSTFNDPRWLRSSLEPSDMQDRSAISIPVSIGERALAILTLLRPQEKCFTEEELNLFQGVNAYQFFKQPQPNCGT